MSEYKPVTVQAASQLAEHFSKDWIIVLAGDNVHDQTHFTSYGRSAADKSLSAGLCDHLATLLGFSPEETRQYADFRTKPAAQRAEEVERLLQLLRDTRAFVPADLQAKIDDLFSVAWDSVSEGAEPV